MWPRYKLSLFFLASLALLGALFWWYVVSVEQSSEVVFLNIGQGDAIFIREGTTEILIDGGRTGRALLDRLGHHMPFWDRTLEFVIATHPDADHIGGLPAVLRSYQVTHVLTTGAESDTDTSRLLQQTIQETLGHGPEAAFRGTKVDLPLKGSLTVEYPNTPLPKETADSNEGSIVARYVFGETSFLLTGDLPHEETFLPEEAPVTILKVAHHGSKYSSSDTFLKEIRPEEAVISVGKNNYGHPDPGVLARLAALGATLHRTDEEGDVRYHCAVASCVYTP